MGVIVQGIKREEGGDPMAVPEAGGTQRGKGAAVGGGRGVMKQEQEALSSILVVRAGDEVAVVTTSGRTLRARMLHGQPPGASMGLQLGSSEARSVPEPVVVAPVCGRAARGLKVGAMEAGERVARCVMVSSATLNRPP